MNRSDVAELHYIAPIENVPSILKHGILSHRRADRVHHSSVAMPEIQEKRSKKAVPGGRPLHDYVNLYFHARNPMMFRRKGQHEEMCVLRVRDAVLDLPDVIITDGNAASGYTVFYPSPAGLIYLDKAQVYARDWRSPNSIVQWRQASARCSEVLVPDCVPPSCVQGAYVSTTTASTKLTGLAPGVTVSVNPDLFFH